MTALHCAWCGSSQLRLRTRSGPRHYICKCGKKTSLNGGRYISTGTFFKAC